MAQAEISGISPFFIVRDLAPALSFYRDKLGFEIVFQAPLGDPFRALMGQALRFSRSRVTKRRSDASGRSDGKQCAG